MGPSTTSYSSPITTTDRPMAKTAPLVIPTKITRYDVESGPSSQPDPRSYTRETAAFSPVNENGCFEFDRVIKEGEVLKKSRRTKTYKPFILVLRQVNLSLYAGKEHTALRHSIPVSEISAVARRRRTKRPRPGLFSVFTPERNYHFDAHSEAAADSWVEQLRISARIDQWDSAVGTSEEEGDATEDYSATASVPMPVLAPASAPRVIPMNRSASNYAQQGTPVGSFSSISSFGAANFRGSSLSLAIPGSSPEQAEKPVRPVPGRTTSAMEVDQERVLRNGRLVLLKSKGGVRKWKPVWAVLRLKSLAIYPNEDEYAPILIISFPSIVNAVEIDSPSRNKKRQFCMQIITEERNWRFCAQDEDDLAAWLGTLKSLLAKRRAAAGETQAAVGQQT